MHVIKLLACKTLQRFQSVFYAQCSFQKKKRFLASFFDGNFRGRATVCVFRAAAHLQGVVLGLENRTKPASCQDASQVNGLAKTFCQLTAVIRFFYQVVLQSLSGLGIY